MADITVRDLDEQTIAVLANRARDHHRTIEAELRQLIVDAVAAEPMMRDDILSQVDAFRERLRGQVTGDSTTLIRAARDALHLVS